MKENIPLTISDAMNLYLKAKSKITGKSSTKKDALEYLDILGFQNSTGEFIKNKVLKNIENYDR